MGISQLQGLLAASEAEVSANPDNIKARKTVNALDGELKYRNKSTGDSMTFGRL